MSATEIDDRNPAVVYSKPPSGHHWINQRSSTSFNNTLSLTNTRNAKATVTFTGTHIAVFGRISDSKTGPGDPISSYSVDDGPITLFTGVRKSETQSRVMLYASNTLGNGRHKLVITNLVEGAFFWLDSFVIIPNTSEFVPNISESTTGSISPSPPLAIIGSSKLTTQSSDVPTILSVSSTTRTANLTQISSFSTTEKDGPRTPPNGPTVASENNVEVGAIVGGVLGGLLLIIFTIFVFLFYRRGRTQRSSSMAGNEIVESRAAPSNSSVVPFHVSPPSTIPISNNLASFPGTPNYFPNLPYGPYPHGFNSRNTHSHDPIGKRQILRALHEQERASRCNTAVVPPANASSLWTGHLHSAEMLSICDATLRERRPSIPNESPPAYHATISSILIL